MPFLASSHCLLLIPFFLSVIFFKFPAYLLLNHFLMQICKNLPINMINMLFLLPIYHLIRRVLTVQYSFSSTAINLFVTQLHYIAHLLATSLYTLCKSFASSFQHVQQKQYLRTDERVFCFCVRRNSWTWRHFADTLSFASQLADRETDISYHGRGTV